MSSPDIINRFLFPTPPSTYGLYDYPEDLIFVPRGLAYEDARPEDCMPCLLLKAASARFLVLYLHSNAEDLGRCHSFASVLRMQFHVHVLVVEYPGYGLCPGRSTEESVLANATLAIEFVLNVLKVPLDEIIVMGRSIGCASATAIAAKYQVHGLVLVCPFLSIRELCRDYFGRAADMLQERFPNSEWIQQVVSPTLIIHGKADNIVPWSHGQALYDLCSSRKRLVIPHDMKHNTNLHIDPCFFVLPMLHFFSLPDYKFEELDVPEWVYDKRLSTFFKERDEEVCGVCVNSLKHAIHGDVPMKCEVQQSRKDCDTGPVGPQPTRVWVEQLLSSKDVGGPAGSPGGAGASGDDTSVLSCSPEEEVADETDAFPEEEERSWMEELPEAPEDLGFFKVPQSRDTNSKLLAAPLKKKPPTASSLLASHRPAVGAGRCDCLRPGQTTVEFAGYVAGRPGPPKATRQPADEGSTSGDESVTDIRTSPAPSGGVVRTMVVHI